MRDPDVKFSDLWMSVYISPGPLEETRPFAEMFVRSWCRKASTLEEADLVVFVGGEDVNPILYGETTKHDRTRFNIKRDEADMALYTKCLHEGIPMLGICRGAQFLHVMNGGKLYQDIDNHVGDHSMRDLRKNGAVIDRVSSVHHQSCIADASLGMEVLATSYESKTRWRNKTDKNVGIMEDVEAFFYRDTCCLGIQGHPEYKGYDQFLRWTFETIYDLIVCNPDIILTSHADGGKGKSYRIRPELMEQRALGWSEKAKAAN